MSTDLEKIKNIYLDSDIDEEDYADNLSRITEWESSLRQNEDIASWQESDITKSIAKQAKESYKELAMSLITNREMTEKQRLSVWAKQDAMLWIISMVAKDAKGNLEQIHKEIKQAIKAEE